MDLEQLQRRSFRALLYRRHLLYPRLCHYMSGRVIDVGCGLGDFLAFRPNTIGVDVNPQIVEWCRGQGLEADLFLDDSRLPFKDGTFQGAVMDNVLEHISEPDQILAEVRRVLEPGATFVVGVPGRCGFASEADHKIFYDEENLVRTLNGFGFSRTDLFHMPLRSSWLDERLRQYCIYGVFAAR